MTLKKFLVVFALTMVALVAGVAYMVVYARAVSTYQTFGFIVIFALWIIFSVEYGGRLQRRAQDKAGESRQG